MFFKSGTTDPEEANTLPNLTMENKVGLYSAFSLDNLDSSDANAWKIISANLLDAPITLLGLTALSVETKITCFAFVFSSLAKSKSSNCIIFNSRNWISFN